MYVTQEKPYLPLMTALALLALPLALWLHEVFAIGVFGHSGLLLQKSATGYEWSEGWSDSIVWFIGGVFGFFNVLLSAGLVKLARQKSMRRHFRYAVFLAGVAAVAAALVSMVLEWVLGKAALGGLREVGVIHYTLSVFILARLTLPKQLTRAPVQPIVFHKMKR